MDAKIMEVADGCDSENYNATRVKIDAYKWRAAHLRPKVYGQKVQAEITGAEGGPLVVTWAKP